MDREIEVIKFVNYQVLNDNGSWSSTMNLMVNWAGKLSSLEDALRYRAYNKYRATDVRIISHQNGYAWEEKSVSSKYDL